MAALNFPANPVNGDIYNGYVYNGTTEAWVAQTFAASPAYISATAPATPATGDLWYDTTVPGLFMYYYDGATYSWVTVGGSTSALYTGNVAPENPNVDDLWFDTTSGILSTFYDDQITYLTNYVVNPAMNVNTYGWSGYSGSENISLGTLSVYNTAPAVTASLPYTPEFQTYGVKTTVNNLTPGLTYYVKASFGYENPDDTLYSPCQIAYKIDGTNRMAGVIGPGNIHSGWPAYFVATSTQCDISFVITAPGGTLGVTYALLSESTAYATGDTTGWHWNGTPYQSTSTQDSVTGATSKQWVQVVGEHSGDEASLITFNFPTAISDGTSYRGFTWSESKQRWTVSTPEVSPRFGSFVARSTDYSQYDTFYPDYDGQQYELVSGDNVSFVADTMAKTVTISAAGGAAVNVASTAPLDANSGDMWYSSTDGNLYVFYVDGDSGQWVQIQATTGTAAQLDVRVAALEDAAALEAASGGLIRLNPQTLSSDYTLPTGYNGMSAGPITIADGVIVTIPDGSAWSIV